jgi:hypothetical protein
MADLPCVCAIEVIFHWVLDQQGRGTNLRFARATADSPVAGGRSGGLAPFADGHELDLHPLVQRGRDAVEHGQGVALVIGIFESRSISVGGTSRSFVQPRETTAAMLS